MINLNNKKYQLTKLYICLVVSLALEIMEIVYAFSFNSKLEPLMMPLWMEWFSFAFSFIVICWIGYKFVYYCYEEIFKYKMVGMYTMITLCVSISCIFSFYPLIYNTIASVNNWDHLSIMSFFPTGAIIVSIVAFGNYLSEKLQHKAEADIEAIASLKIADAFLYDIKTKRVKSISTQKLKKGDYIEIKKGYTVPIDCKIHQHSTYIDESSLTGESKPVKKNKGDYLFGGTINIQNTIIAKVTRTAKESMVSQIIENVKNIQAEKPKFRRIADKIAKWFVPTIILLAILTFFIQGFVPNIQEIFKGLFGHVDLSQIPQVVRALYYSIGVLAVSCPCALGIAVPLASLIGVSKAGKNGIIINHASAYEQINKIDTICFDKTGTLTQGSFNVNKIIGSNKYIELIYNMELHSFHPLATSFTKYVEDNNIQVKKKILKVSEIPGIGLKYKNKKDVFKIVSYQYVLNNLNKLKIPNNIMTNINKYKKDFNDELISISFFIKNNQVLNMITFKDNLNENTLDTIKVLKKRKYKIYMITGDNEKSASSLAKKLGIEYYANVKPNQKAKIVKKLQDEGSKVCYVGDGINDLEVLKQADLSIAINKENAVANKISDISIINKNIMNVIKSIFLIRIIHRMIILNLSWTFFYNIITIPLTMLGYLPAFIAVFAMSFSELFVFINAIIFKSKKWTYLKKSEIKSLNKEKKDFMI